MRVRITYGIDVEKIPEKIQEFGESATDELRRIMGSLELALDDISNSDSDNELAIRAIQKARASLTDVDNILLDVTSILEGLDNYNKGEKNVPERRSTVDSSRDPSQPS